MVSSSSVPLWKSIISPLNSFGSGTKENNNEDEGFAGPELTLTDRSKIKSYLLANQRVAKTFNLRGFRNEEIEHLISSFVRKEIGKDEVVCVSGEKCDDLHILVRGSAVEVDSKHKVLRKYVAGEICGDAEFFGGQKRVTTLKSQSDCVFYVTDIYKYGEILYSLADHVRLSSFSIFRGVAKPDLERLTGYVQKMSYKSGDVILSKGSIVDKIYLIVSGNVVCSDENEHTALLSGGSSFGVHEFINGQAISKSYMAADSVELYSLNSEIIFDSTNVLQNIIERLNKGNNRQKHRNSLKSVGSDTSHHNHNHAKRPSLTSTCDDSIESGEELAHTIVTGNNGANNNRDFSCALDVFLFKCFFS